jgi:hypothetical protein
MRSPVSFSKPQDHPSLPDFDPRLAVIEEAIRLTMTGKIIDFTFDKQANLIRKK